jgi:hypothetical protein
MKRHRKKGGENFVLSMPNAGGDVKKFIRFSKNYLDKAA